ncbi:glutathione S-transferase family protein [Aliikangiella coralliicola]|uniref:Glutathione S-transferase family protein n=1 Tax=Aliikangiella coralliicola TaxID=2592383 RepID=A0A545UFS4_9GAMM|nr:glutathione S-transferase family protein [Aliikangiella coralliicola]TQV88317.1 glutathione S-transferase family protein [Aliikangiella coralliicola]
MYQLYYYPLNASMAPHFVLEELGVDFELLLVDRKSNAQKSADYMALNPTGRIPTLVDGDLILFESPAICIYLAEKHPESHLIPKQGSAERALFFQWMMYLTNTLQAELMLYFYPQRHTNAENTATQIAEAQEQRITEIFALLDSELKNRDYLVGDNLTVCDHFLMMLAVWADEIKKPPLQFENLSRYLKKLSRRKAIKHVCEKENLSLAEYA